MKPTSGGRGGEMETICGRTCDRQASNWSNGFRSGSQVNRVIEFRAGLFHRNGNSGVGNSGLGDPPPLSFPARTFGSCGKRRVLSHGCRQLCLASGVRVRWITETRKDLTQGGKTPHKNWVAPYYGSSFPSPPLPPGKSSPDFPWIALGQEHYLI